MKRITKLVLIFIFVLSLSLGALSGCAITSEAIEEDKIEEKKNIVDEEKNESKEEQQLEENTVTEEKQNSTIITYVSTDSKVYSSTAEVVKNVADTVVEISTESVTTLWGRQYIASGAGSGVIVGLDNNTYYIITNNHVIDGANEITVRTRAGVSYNGRLIATDDSADIAIIAIDSNDELSIAIMGNSDDLQIGEDLIAIGNPLGSLGGTVTKGILSATGRTIQIENYEMTLLQTDTAINPGNSGGGLFNMRGELIGVVNAKTTDEEIEGICFAIPINNALKVYNDLLEYGYILGRATFNIEVAEGTLSSKTMGQQTTNIVYITAINANSAANFAQYDMIYKINGEIISSILDLNIALSKVSAGDEVEVEVYRGSISQSFWSSGISFANESTTFKTVAKQYGEVAN